MNDTGYVPLVDTSRDELRERIAVAHKRFDELVRTADPLAHSPGREWTVQQIVAHVLTVAQRYTQFARGGEYRHAADARDIAALNRTELEAAMAPVPELADHLQALVPEMDGFFDTNSDDRPTIPFHAFGFMSSNTAQTNWLGELLLHGEDIARAVKIPWALPERDMLLVSRGFPEMVPLYVRPGLSGHTKCVCGPSSSRCSALPHSHP